MVFTIREQAAVKIIGIILAIALLYYFFFADAMDTKYATLVAAFMIALGLLIGADFFPDEKLNANVFFVFLIFIIGFIAINPSIISKEPAMIQTIRIYSGITVGLLMLIIFLQRRK